MKTGITHNTETTGTIHSNESIQQYVNSVPLEKRIFVTEDKSKTATYCQFTLGTENRVLFFFF
jgi:hypothetical protein